MNLTGFFTLSAKESRRIIRIWRQTLVPPIITTTLYFLIFGKLIGGRIGEMNGVGYMQFIAPGLVMMNAITASYVNTASSFSSVNLPVILKNYWFLRSRHIILFGAM